MLTLGHPRLQFSKANKCESPAQEGLLISLPFTVGQQAYTKDLGWGAPLGN